MPLAGDEGLRAIEGDYYIPVHSALIDYDHTCTAIDISLAESTLNFHLRGGRSGVSSMESVCPEIVTSLLASGRSYKGISQELKALYPQIQHGLSERSVRRYVKDNNLRTSRTRCTGNYRKVLMR